MPNWVKTKIKCKDKENKFNELALFVQGKYEDGDIREFDFEKVIPMPNNIFQGNLGNEERALYGVNNWYDWSIENWGTKWNASESSVDLSNKTITFESAWSMPIPIIKRLSELFPTIEFDITFADENIGYNLGKFTIKNGVIIAYKEFEFGSQSARSFARRVWNE